MKYIIFFLIFFPFFAHSVPEKVKFYDFDDLLIEGKHKKPQILYTDARQKVKFERLLKLKKDFIPRLLATKKDPAIR